MKHFSFIVLDTLKEDVEFCRRENESLKVENESLNSESHQIYDKLQETQKENDRLKNDLECLLSVQVCFIISFIVFQNFFNEMLFSNICLKLQEFISDVC